MFEQIQAAATTIATYTVTDQRRRGDRTRPLCHPPADRALLSPAST